MFLLCRVAAQPPIHDLAAIEYAGMSILAAIHADGKLVLWDHKTRKRILSGLILEDESLASRLIPRKLKLAVNDSGTVMTAAIGLEPSNPFDRATCQVQFAFYYLR